MDVGIDLFTGLESFTTGVTEGKEDFEERPAGNSSEVASAIFGFADWADFLADLGALTLISFC
jgi:hypothetical protein